MYKGKWLNFKNLDYKVGVPSQKNVQPNTNDNDDDIRDDIAYGTYED